MSFITGLFKQIDKASKEEEDPVFDELEVQEELEDLKLQFKAVTNEVSEATKESLSSKTLKQYERY